MKTKYPYEELTLHARIRMGENVDLRKRDESGDFEQSSSDDIINEYKLYNASPNPFNPSTQISYSIPENTSVELSVYDLQGRLVKELVNTFKAAGNYTITWDGRNQYGNSVSSGLFIYVLRTNTISLSKKMLLIR